MASVRAQRALEQPVADEENDRWPFPCAWVCGACGYLRRPEDLHRPDPLRSTPELDVGVSTACPHCSAAASAAVDLADKAMARSLIDGELHDQQHAPSKMPVVGQAMLGALTAGVGTALLVSGVGLVAGLAGLGSAGFAWSRAATQWRAIRGRPRAPRRWFHAPRPARPLTTWAGVELRGEPLRAPFSGRSCLGYQVSVRWAHRDPDDPRTTALLEQKVGALDISGIALDASGVFLELPEASIPVRDIANTASARAYLASRGLTTTDGEFIFGEAILTTQTPVDVLRDEHGAALVRPSRPPDRSERAALDVG